MDKIASLREIIDCSSAIVFFGGAGVSVPSGIPDFRGTGGLESQNIPFEIILSRDYFLSHPEAFFSVYRDKLLFPDARPNKAHYALARLEAQEKLRAVITQNIDNLHQAAGSRVVIELHGSVYRNYCMKCGKKYDFDFMVKSKGIPRCTCGGIVRPDVVLYQEQLPTSALATAIDHIKKADTLIVAGTSLVVYPAAGLIRYFTGNNMVIINKSTTDYDRLADLVIHDSVDLVLDAIVK